MINLRYYRFRWLPFLFTVIFLFILIWLGLWQIRRYHYHQQLIDNYKQAQQAPAQDFTHWQANHNFAHVWVLGHYLNQYTILLDNRIHKDQPGYEVVTPFQLKNNKILLINRGWIAKTAVPANVAKINQQTLKLSGFIEFSPGYTFILGNNILTPGHWPLLIQKIDINELNHLTHWDLYPFTLRLSPSAPTGFVRDWQPVVMSPAQNLGYAVQWFLLALVLLCGYVIFSCQREKP